MKEEQLKIKIEQLFFEYLKNPIIKLKEMTNSIINTYALYTTDKDVNILFINYERFQNEPKLYKVVDKLKYDYKVYLNINRSEGSLQIQFATWNGLTLNITEQNFSNFEIIKDFFCR